MSKGGGDVCVCIGGCVCVHARIFACVRACMRDWLARGSQDKSG